MVQCKIKSFNEVNIHSPTANLGLSIAFGLVVVYVGYKMYRHFLYWCSSYGREAKAKREPALQQSTSVDMIGRQGGGG